MLQQVIILLLFISALAYLGRMVYRMFQSKSCVTGCGKCSAVDFNKIEKDLNARFAVEKDRA
ncbi:MAG TPA: FeoB-associated Cys-rich membrane protein [Cyclobacteriaceae bacterium]|nr:FeoB-associated Cys-rich membrane protein [Cyclobacteriaceae bacterium]HMV08282.1 FeoB-associated Cys-rich membrane protein [Cyclobacteriaceae bacterium]HMV88441.1 FeoB-associated Cys-rich membrane protein [Cyclobacteriaceae bacterium]HMX02125.1 FeoB-associated Cys-rich membrane protein [Cyclobacteriaceae bacterium]HMX49899.1 FeoB-associated Cys-rich membrane protein [Cyclobacteriaceae bacterium]